jgi:hypothetical protein
MASPFSSRAILDKIDLENEREVDTAEGEQLARAWQCPFYEVSTDAQVRAFWGSKC